MIGNSQHVSPRGNKWSVRRTGASRASRLYDTESEAIARARQLAKAAGAGAGIFIHGRDGQIRDYEIYGDAPKQKMN